MSNNENVIRVTHIQKQFGRHVVLRDVSFEAARSEIIGIVGENGSGKTTLLKILVGLLNPNSGEIQIKAPIAYCPQDPVVFDLLTIRENLLYFGTGYGLEKREIHKKSKNLMEIFNCTKYTDYLVSQVSEGTRQKVNLMISLLPPSDLLLLDEPYQGFDYSTYIDFWNYSTELRKEGKTILVVSHMIVKDSYFDRIISLNGGYSHVIKD